MAVVTLDFESPYSSNVRGDHPMYGLTLKKQTYEEYIFDPRFKVFGFSYKIDKGETEWVGQRHARDAANDLFPQGNDHTMVAHNCLFDGFVLSRHYGLAAERYICTQMMSQGLWNQRRASLEQLCISCYPDDDSIRKGKELVQFANVYDLDEQQEKIMAGYANNDVDITFACLARMWRFYPDKELDLINLTLRMGIHPTFVLDEPRVQQFLADYNEETDRIIQQSGIPRTTLASAIKFPQWVKDNLGIDIPMIASPTENNPNNMKYALSKDEIAFIELQQDYPEYQHIWDARLRAASTIDRTRAERLITHAGFDGQLATPLKYYGAHTGRWGGTNKVNFQNLRRGSELRKSLKAPPGYKVIVADLSNIEGRVLAWFAQEGQLLELFRRGEDVYCDFASGIYGRTIVKGVDDDERFVGKTCLGPNTKVLTEAGWKPITSINTQDTLWDGLQWVSHSGLVANGLRPTMTLAGVDLTPDHLVMIEEGLWEGAATVQADATLFQKALSSANLPFLGSAPHSKTCRTGAKSMHSKPESTNLKPVYDIANAGPRHRFTIQTDDGPVIVHNCILGLGFGTGPPKLRSTIFVDSRKNDPDNPINLSLDGCKDIVYDKYRGRYTKIVEAWADADYAIQQMYHQPEGEAYTWRCLIVEKGRIKLPNGMYLNYPRLQYTLDEYDRPQYEYWNGKHMTKIYGGKLIENIIQALARIIMGDMLLDIDAELRNNPDKYGELSRIGLTVHDEGVAIALTEVAEEAFEFMLERMSVPPDWCNDGTLTLKAEGGIDDCYSK